MILLTGASGGIGSSISKKLISSGYKIIFTSSKKEKLENLNRNYGDEHHYYDLDQSNMETLPTQMDIIVKNHNIDVLINNAGITEDSLFLRMKWSQWKNVLDTNLNSNFLIIKAILPGMIKNKKGKIIGISSVVASSGNPGQSNYVASKAGMVGMYKSIAHEVASRNINVNIISPGFIQTSMTSKLTEQQQDQIMTKIPMKKFGNPEDIANIVNYLVSQNSDYITGQNFHVNGGMLMV